MQTIDLSLVPKTMIPKFRCLLRPVEERFVIPWGGAGAGKSYSVAQHVVYSCVVEGGHKWLVARKVGSTLRHSVVALILHIFDEWGLTGLYSYNKADSAIVFYNGSIILFTGLDDVGKLKSIQGITGIWFEEADEGTIDDVTQLNLRLRGQSAVKKRFYLTFNPVSVLHWLKAEFFDKPTHNARTIHATYRDNPYLDDEYRQELESMDDPYYAAVYREGKWGVLGNVVFTNIIVDDFDYQPEEFENVCYGMDFGFAHASAIECIGFKDGEIYSFDELWGKGWTNQEFIAYAQEKFGAKLKNMQFTADSAEPDRIKEWNQAGVWVRSAQKGTGSVKFGVDFLSRNTWHIHRSKCPNLAREVSSFKRREDRDGNAIDSFVELNDDAIAASRYATEWIWRSAPFVIA
jgi:phage terminase large subunit